MANIKIFTIGFTKSNAQSFFSRLKNAGVEKLIDVRLNNVSQLAGFAKRDDLKFFLKELCNCEYTHKPHLAPTKEILDSYKKKDISWTDYELKFKRLLKQRSTEEHISVDELNNSCLLCSEATAEQCHRRLVAEYFKKHFKDIEIVHL